MKKLVLIKLGGSLITDKEKPYSVRLGVIKRLCREVHNAREKSGHVYIIGHGGGSFPHVPASKYRTHEGFVNKDSAKGIAEVQDSAAQLNRIIIREFIKAKEYAVSFSPSSLLMTENGEVKKAFLWPLLKSLEFEMLPVVYGDVTFDGKKGCNILSTEKMLNFLALTLKKSYKSVKLIYCGTTDGVYDESGNPIEKITPNNFGEIKSAIGASGGIDVTGGMLHKVEESLRIAKKGITTTIINGTKVGELEKVLLDQKVTGTLILK